MAPGCMVEPGTEVWNMGGGHVCGGAVGKGRRMELRGEAEFDRVQY